MQKFRNQSMLDHLFGFFLNFFQDAPKFALKGPKMIPKWPNTAPRGAEMVPRRVQDGPKMGTDRRSLLYHDDGNC